MKVFLMTVVVVEETNLVVAIGMIFDVFAITGDGV